MSAAQTSPSGLGPLRVGDSQLKGPHIGSDTKTPKGPWQEPLAESQGRWNLTRMRRQGYLGARLGEVGGDRDYRE